MCDSVVAISNNVDMNDISESGSLVPTAQSRSFCEVLY